MGFWRMNKVAFRITYPMAFHKDGRIFRKLETRQISQVPQRPHPHPDEPMPPAFVRPRNKKGKTMVSRDHVCPRWKQLYFMAQRLQFGLSV